MRKDKMKEPTKIFISSDENPNYIQFWPLVATAWRRLDFEPVLSLVTDKPETDWKWMKEFGEVVSFSKHKELPAGNWAKMARWWLYFKYENEIGIVSDMDMIPLQKDYFKKLPNNYDPDKHLILKGTYDMSKSAKFQGCYMTATGKVWKDILKPENYESPHEWVKQFKDRSLYDHKEGVNIPYHVFSEESLMRSVVLQWDPYGEKTIRLTRPGGWMHGIKSTSLRVDRSAWPDSQRGWDIMGFTSDKSYPDNLARPNHPPPNEDYYIDAHCPRPLQQYSQYIVRLTDYLGIDSRLMQFGVDAANETFNK